MSVFTEEQRRMIRDYHPSLGDRPPGIDLAQLLEDAFAARDAEVAAIVSGEATILNGNTSVVVALGSAFANKKAVVSFAEAPTAAALIWAGPADGAGDLTIEIDVDNTADIVVHYVADGR